jgi:hypothetical protein
MNMVVSSIYAFCPNGRISALATLTEDQFDELDSPAFIMSTSFKTYEKFGMQPVIFDHPVVLKLLQAYKVKFRPRNCGGPKSPLFITRNGKLYNISRGVTRFFKAELGIHINTTTIRSLVETTMHKALMQGVITPEERAAVMNINGHSSQVTKEYYIRNEREADVANGCSAFKKCADLESSHSQSLFTPDAGAERWTGSSSSASRFIDTTESNNIGIEYDFIECDTMNNSALSFEEEFGLTVEDFSSLQALDYGAKHPNQNKDALRVAWSNEEIKIIGHWCDNALRTNPQWSSTIVARCLTFISSNDEARQYFHPHHVEDSSRLRHGYDCWLKQK